MGAPLGLALATDATIVPPYTAHAHTMDDYESVLFISRDVYVYQVRSAVPCSRGARVVDMTERAPPFAAQIPPRTSNAGYRAAEWGEM